uniref:Translation initiation factor 1 n=1 Tax=Gentiana susanneae TaxID=2787771 RepID=A0A9E6Y9L6_9GENT|nr:translation initiation factor 1 [Gentiana sp. PCF-2020]
MVIFLIHKIYPNRVKVEVSRYDSTWECIIFRLHNKDSKILWFEHPLIVE